MSGSEAARLCRAARTVHVLQRTGQAYRNGEISADHLDVARLDANPLVRPLVSADEAGLVAEAKASSCRDFRHATKEWERLADEEGALAITDRQHANRAATMQPDFDGFWLLTASFGGAQGTVIAEILERFDRVELDADWTNARAQHGESATVDQLPRTAHQRRADALRNVFVTAASTPANAHRPEPLVNIVMTSLEWELAVARSTRTSTTALAPDQARLCSTVEGNAINPLDAFGAALQGEVRRVVIDTAGVVIDLGRKSRLFSGSARDAALLAGAACVWPGCDQIGSRNQVDHLVEWRHGGSTDQHNAGILCRFHNRWKSSHNVELQRGIDGTWHTTTHEEADSEATA